MNQLTLERCFPWTSARCFPLTLHWVISFPYLAVISIGLEVA
jgi:hypothetical protein